MHISDVFIKIIQNRIYSLTYESNTANHSG